MLVAINSEFFTILAKEEYITLKCNANGLAGRFEVNDGVVGKSPNVVICLCLQALSALGRDRHFPGNNDGRDFLRLS
jgi:hypothetical protein